MAHSTLGRPPHNNTALGTIMFQLLNASPMDGTKRAHGRAIYSFVQFAAEHFQGIPYFHTSTSILVFIARLRAKHYAPSTITSYVSALSYLHKLCSFYYYVLCVSSVLSS